jgi:hypothetical protein
MSDTLARCALLAALDIADVEPGGSAFSDSEDDDALWIDARQIAHEIAGDAVEVRLTLPVIRAEKAGAMADPRVTHPRQSSEWVTVTLGGPDDVGFARDLIALAADAYRPSAGAVLRRPPSRTDLARRRRFH